MLSSSSQLPAALLSSHRSVQLFGSAVLHCSSWLFLLPSTAAFSLPAALSCHLIAATSCAAVCASSAPRPCLMPPAALHDPPNSELSNLVASLPPRSHLVATTTVLQFSPFLLFYSVCRPSPQLLCSAALHHSSPALLPLTTAPLLCCPSPQLFCSAALNHSSSALRPFTTALLLCCPSPQLFYLVTSVSLIVAPTATMNPMLSFYLHFLSSFCYHLLLINSILLALSVLPVHAGSICCPPTVATLSFTFCQLPS